MSNTEEHILVKGTQIKEFKITGLLGEGGFGITYLAQDTQLDRKVAIKEYFPSDLSIRARDSITIKPKSSTQDNYQFGLEKFLEEAKTLAQFKHPNIVGVNRFIEANNTAYLIMEYEEGEDLNDYLKRTGFSGGMPETELKGYLVPILNGLQAVHEKGLLHRDVKPGNIYLRKGAEPMLIDFGAARYALGEHSKSMSAIISMGYAPPEQYSSKAKQSPASDLYAWGATAYQLITGKAPVESPDRSNAIFEEEPDPLKPISQSHAGKYSKELLATIDQCLNIAQKNRPQSAEQVLAMLSGKKLIKGTIKVDPKERFKDSHSNTGTQYVHDEDRFKTDKTESVILSEHKRAEDQTAGQPFGHAKRTEGLGAGAQRQSPKAGSQPKLKYALTFLILAALATASYYGYDYYQEHQQIAEQAKEQQKLAQEKAQREENQAWTQAQQGNTIASYQTYLDKYPNGKNNTTATNKITELKAELGNLTSQAQKLLIKLGYQVPTNGQMDTRTEESIKAFEKAQNLIITGKADQVLINSLQAAYNEKDQAAWNAAQGDITKLQSYANNYPDGQYINQVDSKINQVQQAIADAEAEKQRLAKLAADKKAEDERKRQAQIAAEKARVGKTFADCSDCPTMVYLPSGSFQMGSNEADNEKPIHTVNIQQFAMGQSEVTFAQWDACYNAGGCSEKADDEGWGRGNRPVINVSWNDAQEYTKWLSQKTGKSYRLPSESEWEYAARAGSRTKYSWGDSISCSQARYVYFDCDSNSTKPVKFYDKNAFGLYDMHGNVWEWIEDKWHDNYNGAPTDGSAWTSGGSTYRVLRGGSWVNALNDLRSAFRGGNSTTTRVKFYGFRLAQNTE